MFCLDTNIVIYYQNNHPKVFEKLINQDPNQLCIAHTTRAELFYGAFKSGRVEENLKLQTSFCQEIQVIGAGLESDKIFGEIKTISRKTGFVIADLDLQIASICMANNLVLVTNNTKHFRNITGLKLEDWTR